MSPTKWTQVMEILADALDRPAQGRAAFLEERCAGDAELKAEVERLLRNEGADAFDELTLPPDFPRQDAAPVGRAPPTNPQPPPQPHRDVPEDRRDPFAHDDEVGHRGSRSLPTLPGYEILRELSHGGQGVVYQAIQESTKRKVAVKVLLQGPYASKAARRHFEREIELVSHLKHPNIISVFDSGETADGRLFYVMEYVRGTPITQYVRDQKLGLEETLKLFAGLCDAVNHAHQKAVIHRDLKPSNILVDGEGNLKILDFGLAKALTQTTETLATISGQVMGTLPYMSPEQTKGNPELIDTRTDVYALGVILYEMLTGAYPYPVIGEMAEVLRHISETQPQPLMKSWTKESGIGAFTKAHRSGRCPIDDEVQTIALKALAKEKERRYQSAADVGEDIRHYLAKEPIEAKRDSAIYLLKKILRRHRAPVAVVLLFLLLSATSAVVFWRLWGQAQSQRDKANAAALSERWALEDAKRERDVARTARTSAEFEAYVATVTAADLSLAANEPARVRARLDACEEHLRGWEWGWLNARSDNSLLILRGHEATVNSATFNSSGTRIVTASSDGTARVWDASSGRELTTLRGHAKSVTSAAFSPEDTRIVTASVDKTARVWDASSGKELALLRGHEGEVDFAAFSPDGTRIVTAAYYAGTVRVWNAASGKELTVLPVFGSEIKCIGLSPDGMRIVTGYADGKARIWDASSGKELALPHGHISWVESAAFSPDGRRIVTASLDAARVWDAVSGKELAMLRDRENPVAAAAFSPNGSRIVTASGAGTVYRVDPASGWTARVWDSLTGRELALLRGHAGLVRSAVFSPDGTRIVTNSADKTVRVWDAGSGNELALLRGHEGDVNSAAFSPDGTRIVTASADNTARVWDASSRREPVLLLGHSGSLHSAAFSPDGSRIVTAAWDEVMRVWDSSSGKELAWLHGHTSYVNSAVFSHDGTRILTASEDKTARVWDAGSGKELAQLRGHESAVTCALFSPGGTRIVTASTDKTIRTWDAGSGQQLALLRGHNSTVFTAAFNSSGTRIVSASRDKTARIWDASSGKELTLLRGHEDSVHSAAFDPSGTRIVTASADKTARVWDASSGKELRLLHGHEDGVSSAAFSPNGTRIVTASRDQTARVWDADSGKELALLRGHEGPVVSAEFCPDGTRIVTASYDLAARVWDSVPFRERYPTIMRAQVAEAKMAPIINSMLNSGQSIAVVMQKIDADSSLTGDERTAARTDLNTRVERQDRLSNDFWDALRSVQFAPARAARVAVAKVREVLTLDPNENNVLNTLGVALYRADQFQEALDTLTRTAAINAKSPAGDQPADWAFIAMAGWKLNQPDEARAALAKLRALAAMDRWKTNEETTRWLKEAEELIDAAATTRPAR